MAKNIKNILIDMEIYPDLSGFKYICKAVECIQENIFVGIRDVYEKVANEFGASSSMVERAIRYAFSKADTDCETYKQYMSNKDTTNSARLFTLAIRLKDS